MITIYASKIRLVYFSEKLYSLWRPSPSCLQFFQENERKDFAYKYNLRK